MMAYRGKYPHRIHTVSGNRTDLHLYANDGEHIHLSTAQALAVNGPQMPELGDSIIPFRQPESIAQTLLGQASDETAVHAMVNANAYQLPLTLVASNVPGFYLRNSLMIDHVSRSIVTILPANYFTA